jgi:hypothetical protein
MATTTPNFGWPVPTSTDLVKDGATAIEALGDGIDTSLVDLKGGTTGQVLAKATSADMDFAWVAQDDSNAIQNAIVDAKGDLIAATANDTPARLAVGANGETLVAESLTSTGLRYQVGNGLAQGTINGGFDIWQRSTSTSSGGYSNADRWYVDGIGFTFSRESTIVPTGSQYSMKLLQSSGTNTFSLNQAVETANAVAFAGQTVTLSQYIAASASTTLGFSFYYSTSVDVGPTGSWTQITASSGTASATVSTTTFTRIAAQYAVPSTAKSLLIVSNGTVTNGTAAYIGKVQLEVGSVATEFRRAGGTIQGELAACQRYYWRTADLASSSAWMSTGLAITTSSVYFGVQYPVQMRVKPTVLDYAFPNVTLAAVGYTGGTLTQVANGANANTSSISYNHTSAALTVDKIYLCGLAGNGYIGFGAEL